MANERNIYLDGIMGVVVGDALGVPVEFTTREELDRGPVEEMEAYGTFNLPAGSWSDDSSLTLATLDSLRNGYHPEDIMAKFVQWMEEGDYTPFGKSFDIGNGTADSIDRYMKEKNLHTCGGTTEYDNGNGALLRIMPVCLYCYKRRKSSEITDQVAIKIIHEVSGLTHNHLRGQMACGLYYFITCELLDETGTLFERVQSGLNRGFEYYKSNGYDLNELKHYERLRELSDFQKLARIDIQSYGYVVVTLEAAIWSLLNTDSFEKCELMAVNLGSDTDTVSAIAGGLAGIYYGYKSIPLEWLSVIQKRDWIEKICKMI